MEHRGVIWVDLNDIYFDTVNFLPSLPMEGGLLNLHHILVFWEWNHCVFISEPDRQAVKKVVTEVELRALEDILAHVASQTTKEEQEYMAEENIQNQVQKDILTFKGSFL
uniref:Uncharacterized protein n=1 Tax=Salix viminalis TaxID=40686 RepID=A0A6N2MU64_SALVM